MGRRVLSLAALLLCFCSIAQAQYTWRLILPRLSYTVRVNALDPQKLYVGSTDDQLWRSYDGGASWERIVLAEFQQDDALTSVLTSSVDTNIVFVAGYRINGIHRSTDGGHTITEVLHDQSVGRCWFISEALIEDPSNPSTLYAARGQFVNTIYKSTDVGATWDSVGVIDPTITNRLCTIAIRSDSTNILFVGAKGGTILRSLDAGRTWGQVPVQGAANFIKPSSEIPKIVFSPINPRVGYAIVAYASPEEIVDNGGLLKTTDGGASWGRVAFADTSLWAVEVRASSLGTDDVFVGGFRLSGRPLIIKGDSIVSRSIDGGNTWTRFNNIAWGPTADGDTLANVWSLRYNKQGNKLYMAAETGLYVLDEPTSVSEVRENKNSLQVTIVSDMLHVVNPVGSTSATKWTVFDIDGAAVATGQVVGTNELTLSVASFANGTYLMTWGTEQQFRTVSFLIAR